MLYKFHVLSFVKRSQIQEIQVCTGMREFFKFLEVEDEVLAGPSFLYFQHLPVYFQNPLAHLIKLNKDLEEESDGNKQLNFLTVKNNHNHQSPFINNKPKSKRETLK